MKTPNRPFWGRTVLFTAGMVGLAIAAHPATLLAATEPVPTFSLDVKKAEPKAAEKNKTDNPSNHTDVYTITVRNTAKIAAKGVTVEYHIYNRTNTTTNGKIDSTVEDITNSASVDIDPGKFKEISSSPVRFYDSQAMPGAGKAGARNFTTTAVMGWRVNILLGGKIVAHKESSDNLAEQLKKMGLN